MDRTLLSIGIAVGLFILIFDAYISYVFVKDLALSIEQKTERLEDIVQFQNYLSMLKDAETGQRGYLITGNQLYLEPYEQGLQFLKSKKTEEFLEKAEKQKTISQDVTELKILTPVKLDELRSVIAKYNSSGFEAAKAEVSTHFGKHTMDHIRNLINNILVEKNEELDAYEDENNTKLRYIIHLLISVNIIYLIVSICLYIFYLNKGKRPHA